MKLRLRNYESKRLQSLGITIGDLIYFFVNPNAFSFASSTQIPQSVTPIQDPNQMEESRHNNQDAPVKESSQFQEPMSEEPDSESMYIDSSALSERLSEPYFLRKVLREELSASDNGKGIHKRMAIAVHAVLLESGLVGFDPVSGLQIYPDRFRVPNEFRSPFSLCYSLPELLRDDESNLIDYVVLKFLTLGQFFNFWV